MNATSLLDTYDARLAPHRRKFADGPAAALGVGTPGDPALFSLFLIHYCAWGVGMTRGVEDWMRRAGDRCRSLGEDRLGSALISHAAGEAGHHRLMIDDAWALAERWNLHRNPKIDPPALFRAPHPRSVCDYAALHETTIRGTAPWAQIAIEYEIEALSVRHGPDLLAAANGFDGLSFLREHVELDAAHTEFNRRQLAALLARRPDALGALVDSGARALRIYGRFVADCFRAAMNFRDSSATDSLGYRLLTAPDADTGTVPGWLRDVRELRSRVLYADGARLSFGPDENDGASVDAADFGSRHLLLVDGETPVGAVRLHAPASTGTLPDATFGDAVVDRCLARRQLCRDGCAIASGLVLDPAHRRGGTALRLLAGLWAVAAETGAQALVAAVGTASRQDRLFALFGAEMADEAGRVTVPRFDDALRLAIYRVDPASPPDYAEIEQMQAFVRLALARERAKPRSGAVSSRHADAAGVRQGRAAAASAETGTGQVRRKTRRHALPS